jgi:hypothetical protein
MFPLSAQAGDLHMKDLGVKPTSGGGVNGTPNYKEPYLPAKSASSNVVDTINKSKIGGGYSKTQGGPYIEYKHGGSASR